MNASLARRFVVAAAMVVAVIPLSQDLTSYERVGAAQRATEAEIAQWNAAVTQIANAHGITEAQASANLAALLRNTQPTAPRPKPVVAPAAPSTGSGVDRWHNTAIAAGWSEAQWPWVKCVIRRESNGVPTAHNTKDPLKGSLGLMQINSVNVPTLQKGGVLSSFGELANPYINLRAAKVLFDRSGKSPWRSRTKPC